MEQLHKQVLPFLMRRLKQDVLDDLPPKIVQDYYCELSPLQHSLYEEFTRTYLSKELDGLAEDSAEPRRKVCERRRGPFGGGKGRRKQAQR